MANNIDVKDAAAATKTLKTTDTAGVHVPHHNVDVSALPTGAATSAKQDTIIGHLDGVEGLLTTIDADTGTLAGAVSGSEVQVDVLTLPASTNTLEVVGDVADDAGSAGNPVSVGGVAKAFDGTTPGSVSAEDDRASLITDLQRRLYTNPHNPFFWRANENHATAQTANALKAAPGSGLALFVQTLVISNGATAGNVKLVEDTGGTPTDIAGPYYFRDTGGIAVNFEPPLKLTSDKDLGFTSATVTTHTVTVSGFTAPG